MILRRIECEATVVAVLVLLCIAVVFLFPPLDGPYSAVNGPVTALQSAQNAARVRVGIVQAAFTLVNNIRISSLIWMNFATIVRIEPEVPAFLDNSTILRC